MRTTRISRLAFPFVAASLLAIAPACDDESETKASFSKASAQDRIMAVGAARGDTFQMATLLSALLAEAGAQTGCPKVTVQDGVTTVAGGCTLEGTRFEGSIRLENLDALDGSAPNKPVSLSWDDFRMTEDGQTLRFDGSVAIEPEAGKGVIHADFLLGVAGKIVELDGTMTCTDAGQCTPAAGSNVMVSGLGTAEVRGAWTGSDEGMSGSMELVGADTLKVDFASESPEGCYAATIDGAATAAVCVDAEEEEEEEDELRAALRSFTDALSAR